MALKIDCRALTNRVKTAFTPVRKEADLVAIAIVADDSMTPSVASRGWNDRL